MQESALLQRSSVLAIIEELERLLHSVIEAPLKQELDAARAEGAAEATAAAALATAAIKPPKSPKEWEKEKKAAVTKARKEATLKTQVQANIALETAVKKASEDAINITLETVLEILYFSSVLDPGYSPHSGYAPYSAERVACLFSAHQSRSSLTQDELNTLCYIGRLLTTKSYFSPESHQDALAACKKIALRIISQTEAQLHPTVQPGVTGKTLKQTVDAIKALEFFTLTPPSPPQPATAAAVTAGASIVMGHEHGTSSYFGVNTSNVMAPATDLPHQQPHQPYHHELQRQPLPATPALAVPGVAISAPISAPAQQQQQQQKIQVPSQVPSQVVQPEKIKKEENLMTRFFGAPSTAESSVQQQKQMQQQNHNQHQQSSGPVYTSSDSQLDQNVDSTASLIAPTPTALPTPSPAVLTVPVAAKKRRNYSSRGPSQSRGSGGAGPVLAEAGTVAGISDGGGNGVRNGGGNKGRGGSNIKKQAVQHYHQQPQYQSHPQQQEQRPPTLPCPSGDAGPGEGVPRPNSKNGYYPRRPRMQQHHAS